MVGSSLFVVKVELINELSELENWEQNYNTLKISVYSCSPREIGKTIISWGKFEKTKPISKGRE